MAVQTTTKIDGMSRKQQEELFLMLLSYAGPPPSEGNYSDWCDGVERGIMVMHPKWDEIDMYDATIKFRHWCNNHGAVRMASVHRHVEGLLNWLTRRTI